MGARKFPFRQADVLRAVKGVKAGGVEVGRVEVDTETGKIVIVAVAEMPVRGNHLDEWLANHAG